MYYPLDRQQHKDIYQRGLEEIISKMEEASAQIIWVTTTPIPHAYGRGDSGNWVGKNVLLNRWAAEVMGRHPSIAVVDLWPIVERDSRYAEWWQLRDFHFSPSLAEPLGRAIADEVLRVLEQGGVDK